MTLHEVNFVSPSNSNDSISEFSHEQDLESNTTSLPLPSHNKYLNHPISLRKDTKNCTK